MSMRLSGVGVSAGHAGGPITRVAEALPEPAAGASTELNDLARAKTEAARIRPAAQAAADELFRRATALSGEARTLLETCAAMATDPTLLDQAEELVTSGALRADRAVFESAAGFVEALRGAGGYMAERARDVTDVRDRVIAELHGEQQPGVAELTDPAVLLARDLAPADTAGLDPERVLALVTEEGGPTSHTAILARSLGIPAVVAVRGLLDSVDRAVGITVDGESGQIDLHSEPVSVRTAERGAAAEWDGRGVTADGHPVKLLANIGSVADSTAAITAGAQGVGLFRTEFCFLSAQAEPSVDEQRAAYRDVLQPFAGKSVIVRTLDAGAEKSMPFAGLGAEANPALGVRGLRVAFDRAELLDRQLAAIAGAAADTGADVAVMAPMVATAAEARWFAVRARTAGIDRVGVMIEVPAAAVCAAELLSEVDFLSIGTNDLAQYTFAADRTLGTLATLNDPWQPALLRLVSTVADQGVRTGRAVGVCGEAAADPLLARVFAGFGVTALSMSAGAFSGVGAALAGNTRAQCERAARAVLGATEPGTARTAAKDALG